MNIKDYLELQSRRLHALHRSETLAIGLSFEQCEHRYCVSAREYLALD